MKIYEKLMKIQTGLKAPKGQFNKFGNYSYRSCEDVLEALKPLLAENKCVLVVTDEPLLVGDRYYIKATAQIIDIEDGESVETTALAREDETRKGMDLSQVTGSTSSYARKYALNGLFCIDDNKDSDNTNKHGKEDKSEDKPSLGNRPAPPTPTAGKINCAECKTEIQQPAVITYSTNKFGRALCRDCQAKVKGA